MHRIDGADHVSNTFSEGTPGVVPATQVTDDWLNDVQEELAQTIEDAGITLVKGTPQLADAIIALLEARFADLSLAVEVGNGLAFIGSNVAYNLANTNALHKSMLPKAWLTCGTGSATPTPTDGGNIHSVAVTPTLITVTLATPMANANFAVNVQFDAPYLAYSFTKTAAGGTGGRATVSFFVALASSGVQVNDLDTVSAPFNLLVFGKQ